MTISTVLEILLENSNITMYFSNINLNQFNNQWKFQLFLSEKKIVAGRYLKCRQQSELQKRIAL